MWKRSAKRTVRAQEENIGCMQGLFKAFGPGRSTPKLLPESPKGRDLSSGNWNPKKKSKAKIPSNAEERPENLVRGGNVGGGKTNSDAASVYSLKEERMPKVQQPKQNSDAGSKRAVADSGSPSQVSKNQKQTNRTFGVVSTQNADSTRISTNLDSSESHLSELDGVSSKINVASLLDASYRNKRKDEEMLISSKESQTNHMGVQLDQPNVQLPQDDPVLQKTIDEVLENLLLDKISNASPTTSDGATHQSEDSMNMLETLKSSKEIFLKVLQDPKILSLLLAKHIENLQNVQNNGAERPDSEESFKLEEIESLENGTGSSMQCEERVQQKQNTKEFFLDTLECTEPSRESVISQKVSTIVVLKPITTRNQSSSDLMDPISPSQSSYSSNSNKESDWVFFNFLFQEIKRRLKQTFGMSQKRRHLISDEVPNKIPSRSRFSGNGDEWIAEYFKAPNSICSSSSEQALQPSRAKAKSKSRESVMRAESEFTNGTGSSKYKNNNVESKSLEELPSPIFGLGKDKEPVLSPEHTRYSTTCLKQEINLEQLCPSTLQFLGGRSTAELQILDSDTSSPKDFPKTSQIYTGPVEESSNLHVVCERNSKEPTDAAEACEHDGSSPFSTLDSEKKPLLDIPSVPSRPDPIVAQHMGTPESKKPEWSSTVSIRESLLLDKIIRPGSIKAERGADEFRISTRMKTRFQECDDSEVTVAAPNPETNFQTCVEDDEFKFEYMRALLEASGLCHCDTADRGHTSNQLLDPSLYDEVETPSDEIPDDLRLLFDCVSEVLEDIHETSSSCMPWVSFVNPNLHSFPNGEQLIQEAWKGLKIHFVRWLPITMDGIVKMDLDKRTWIDIRLGLEEVGIEFADEIVDDIMEEMIAELLN